MVIGSNGLCHLLKKWGIHPAKINSLSLKMMGLVQIIVLSKWVIYRFQPLIFQGVYWGYNPLNY